jgi:protein TonB
VTKHFLVFLLLGFAVAARADDRNDATVRTLCERSNQVSGLKFDSPQPFAMKVNVHVLKTFANPALEGTVAFIDTGTFWREDLRFPEYGTSVISDGKKVWQMESTAIEPGLIRDTVRLVNASPSMRPFPNAAVRKNVHEIKKKTELNRKLTCIESEQQFETCFDDAIGTTVSQADEHARWVWSDFEEFHGKLVPRKMEYFWQGQPFIIADVVGLDDVIPDPKLFVPSAGYSEKLSCREKITPPKLVHSEDPRYPEELRGKMSDVVMVTLTVHITAQGTVADAIVSKASTTGFDSAAMDAVRRWKFDPAKCEGKPMPVEITVEVNFHP